MHRKRALPDKKAPHLKKKKSAKKEEIKICTGIEGYDELINGGFEKYSTNLIVGGAGSGKTIFGVEFLIGGMERGEKCLFITFEEKKAPFYSHIAEVGHDLKAYEQKGLLTFLEYSPEKVEKMLEEGGGEIESIIISKKIERVVIDSITSFTLLFEDELEKRESSLKLFNIISSWKCTSLLTFEEDTDPNSTNIATSSKALQFESDSITLIYYPLGKDGRERFLEVLKMRGTKHSRTLHKFEITASGIKVDPKGRKK